MSEPFVKDQAHRERIENGEAILPSYPVTEQDFLEDNIATVAFHLGQPGARLSVSHDGPGLIVEPGEVLKEISRRLGGVAQTPLMQQLQHVIEGIILRRIYEKRIEGYTIEMAKEIAETLAVPSTDRSYPDPADRWEGWPDPEVTPRATPPVDNPLKAYTVEQLGFEIAKRVAVSSTHGEGGK